jgi:hypothetical protein
MKPLVRVPLIYGLIAGLLGAILVVGLYYVAPHPFLIPVFLDFRIFLFGVFVFFVLKELRDHYQGGTLYFGQGMMASFIFITLYAIVSSALITLFAYWEKSFVTSFIDLFTKQVQGLGEEEIRQIGKDNIERNLKALASTNAFWMGWNYFKQCYWIGLLVSIILSVTLRRQPKT